jgi:hypothetical protein
MIGEIILNREEMQLAPTKYKTPGGIDRNLKRLTPGNLLQSPKEQAHEQPYSDPYKTILISTFVIEISYELT